MIELRSTNENLQLARGMLDEMENFLLSKEVFWPLDAGAATRSEPYPRMSLGTFLLTLDQLESQAGEMSAEQVSRAQVLRRAYLEISQEWPVNMGKKAVAEMRQRANLWRAYLQDLVRHPGLAKRYPAEVKNRALVERLRGLARGADGFESVLARVDETDRLLRSRFQPGEFVWDQRLAGAYPPDHYWFLAGRPVP